MRTLNPLVQSHAAAVNDAIDQALAALSDATDRLDLITVVNRQLGATVKSIEPGYDYTDDDDPDIAELDDESDDFGDDEDEYYDDEDDDDWIDDDGDE